MRLDEMELNIMHEINGLLENILMGLNDKNFMGCNEMKGFSDMEWDWMLEW